MNIRIYFMDQVKFVRDKEDVLKEVWDGDYPFGEDFTLEVLFDASNGYGNYKGFRYCLPRSLSVGDIVEIPALNIMHRVLAFGWQRMEKVS